MRTLVKQTLLLIALGAALAGIAGAQTSSPAASSSTAARHMGVASCAASVCHGKVAAQPGSDVALNEYRIWLLQDRHSQAYRALDRPLAKAIASKLGLKSATEKICTACHADSSPDALHGPKFQLSDGVGCEACHGGAERWIESHAQKNATHADNIARGMYPTEVPARRADLCLSCHYGNLDKFVTHQLIAAGHPRLRFELDTFSANQPAHYKVDAAYIKRKGKVEEANLWVAGQLEAARANLAALQSTLFNRSSPVYPELAFYDCFACHHSVDKLRWTPERAGPGVPPGALRLQKQHLLILQAVAESVGEPKTAEEIRDAGNNLTRAAETDVGALRTDARQLLDFLTARGAWTPRSFSTNDMNAIRRTLLRYGENDRASDFLAAEQIFLGVSSLSYALGDYDKHAHDMEILYNTLKTSASFDPALFASAAREVAGRF
jgi:hypothetical protein